jgi:hypothetical protein
MNSYWSDGVDALYAFLGHRDGWEKIQRHFQIAIASDQLSKAMTDADKKFLTDLLADFTYFNGASSRVDAILKATSFATFEDAGKFALEQLGVKAADFELRNEHIRELLLERRSAGIFATRNFVDEVFSTITNQFYELGRNPYHQDFLDELKSSLGYKSDWQAKRFSLTETGIASELAQAETYRRNGVGSKRWNIQDVNTRDAHLALSGVVIAMADQFDVGGFEGDHPLDPKLPASELVNCHCWMSPVVDENFQLDPANLWEGQ